MITLLAKLAQRRPKKIYISALTILDLMHPILDRYMTPEQHAHFMVELLDALYKWKDERQ